MEWRVCIHLFIFLYTSSRENYTQIIYYVDAEICSCVLENIYYFHTIIIPSYQHVSVFFSVFAISISVHALSDAMSAFFLLIFLLLILNFLCFKFV